MWKGEKCQLRHNFFGLTHDYMKDVYRLFITFKNHSNWSFLELYNLPVALRTWLIEEFIKQKADETEAKQNNQR